VVGADAHDLADVQRAAAAERDHHVGFGRFVRLDRRDGVIVRRVLADAVEHHRWDATGFERALHLLANAGFGHAGVGDDQRFRRAERFRLRRQRS
jgi:hypothetical protein